MVHELSTLNFTARTTHLVKKHIFDTVPLGARCGCGLQPKSSPSSNYQIVPAHKRSFGFRLSNGQERKLMITDSDTFYRTNGHAGVVAVRPLKNTDVTCRCGVDGSAKQHTLHVGVDAYGDINHLSTTTELGEQGPGCPDCTDTFKDYMQCMIDNPQPNTHCNLRSNPFYPGIPDAALTFPLNGNILSDSNGKITPGTKKGKYLRCDVLPGDNTALYDVSAACNVCEDKFNALVTCTKNWPTETTASCTWTQDDMISQYNSSLTTTYPSPPEASNPDVPPDVPRSLVCQISAVNPFNADQLRACCAKYNNDCSACQGIPGEGAEIECGAPLGKTKNYRGAMCNYYNYGNNVADDQNSYPWPSDLGPACYTQFLPTEATAKQALPSPGGSRKNPKNQICINVDGGWTEWGGCSAICGGGGSESTGTQTRSCTNPLRQGLGADCVGPSSKDCVVPCGDIDGGWTDWSDCPEHCDGAVGTQTRTCTNPPPQAQGADCSGPSSKDCDGCYEACSTCIDDAAKQWCWETNSCQPINSLDAAGCQGECVGGYPCTCGSCLDPSCKKPRDGGWSPWSSCVQTAPGASACTIGTQTRTCTNPPPLNGGADCVGSPSQECDACSYICVNNQCTFAAAGQEGVPLSVCEAGCG